jgi:tRNA-2-methylthio-N6-dimethylallyladenosine synthase
MQSSSSTMKVLLVLITLATQVSSLSRLWGSQRLTGGRPSTTSPSSSSLPSAGTGTSTSTAPVTGSNVFIPDLKDVPTRINQIVLPSKIDAIRVRLISVRTKELAEELKQTAFLTTSGNDNEFAALASSISLCEETKHNGGESGWIGINNEALTPTAIAPEVINAAVTSNKGDVKVVASYGSKTGDTASADSTSQMWHVVQLIDVMAKLSPQLAKRRKDTYDALKGISTSTTNAPGKYFIDTMGCQMNIADSERMEGQLVSLGYQRTDDSTSAQVVLLNSCAIRDHAEQKVYSYIGPHALRKRQGEDLSIVVAGCVAQQEGDRLLRRFPEIDIVMGPQYANRLSDLLESVAEGNQVVATEAAYQMEDSLMSQRRSDVTGFVNVIYGCNERCTYCVVPTTRGVEQSRTPEAIVKEIGELVKLGYKEVTLLGQNVDAWGRDMNPKQKFADLLALAGEVPGIQRVRFLTSHPRYMSTRVIQAVANNSRVLMPNFNVPFQSGDDSVLQNMRRGYTRARYLEIIKSIRQYCPDAAITTDVIVGFPGETEEQFMNTLSLMEEVKFEQVNTAAYSPRPNTPAAEWDNQLSEEVKQDRLQRINRLATTHAFERSKRFEGRIQDVLVEDVSLKNPAQVFGRNPHNRLVYFDGSLADLKGQIVQVEITEARPYSLVGRLIK